MNSTILEPNYQPSFDLLLQEDEHKTDELTDNHAGIICFKTYDDFVQNALPVASERKMHAGSKTNPKIRVVKELSIDCSYVDKRKDLPCFCPKCNSQLVSNGERVKRIREVPHGASHVILDLNYKRLRCPNRKCNYTYTFRPAFVDDKHRITTNLRSYIEMSLLHQHTIKDIHLETGVCRNIIMEIDKERLLNKYTNRIEETVVTNGKEETVVRYELKVPKEYSKHLAVDEFLLHKGHKYATVIIDLDTGRILHLSHGKKKECIYEFMDRMGDEWMSHVEAVACDMNANFEQAFHDRYPKIDIVYDRFHIVKNFNDKVIARIRIEEQKRLRQQGDKEGAKLLKGSKYILLSNQSTRLTHDLEALRGKILKRESILFNRAEYKRKGGKETRYEKIINENELLFVCDWVKEHLKLAYSAETEAEMDEHLGEIIDVSIDSGDSHLFWFAKLIADHLEGIITFPKHGMSTGKLEGINNKIKTVRRQAYGYKDDEYFFLKLMDMNS